MERCQIFNADGSECHRLGTPQIIALPTEVPLEFELVETIACIRHTLEVQYLVANPFCAN